MMSSGVAITGIGQSAVGRRLNRSGLSLTIDAVQEALDDAGLNRTDIDGVATYPGRLVGALAGFSPVGSMDLIQAMKLRCNYFSGSHEGCSQLIALVNAFGAIKAGLCHHVILFRTLTEASNVPWYNVGAEVGRDRMNDPHQYLVPFDARTAINWFAMWAQRHFHLYGTTREQLGWVAVNGRRNAILNPKAVFTKPLTIDDYMNAPMLSTPLTLLDCDPLTDCSTAYILSSAEAAADLKSKPIAIEALAGSLHDYGYWDQMDMPHMAAHDSAKDMWSRTDLKPSDVDVALIYDGFSIITITWLEALGFCGIGESAPFIEGGARIALDGELPMNPHGGQLSAGRTHGFGFVHEAVTQLRGQGGPRQVKNDPEVAVVAVGGGLRCGCMLLTRQ